MNFTLNSLILIVSFILAIPPIVIYIVKVMSRNQIEIVLEDKYKNKVNEFAEKLIFSLGLATIISVLANSFFKESVYGFTSNILAIILLFLLFVFIISILISWISLICIKTRRIINKQRVLKFHKVNFVVQYLSILCIDAMLFLLIGDQKNIKEKAILVAFIASMYMVSMLLLNYNLSQVVKNENLYEIKIFDNKLNESLENLILLYSLNKEMLIMRNKTDVNKSIYDLEEFYVYYLNSGFIHQYRKIRDAENMEIEKPSSFAK